MVTKEERRKMAWELFLAAEITNADVGPNIKETIANAWYIVDAFLEAETDDGEAEDLEAPVVEGDTIEAVKERVAAWIERQNTRDGGVSEAAVRVGYNRTVER